MGKYDEYFVETLPGGRRPDWVITHGGAGPTVAYLDDRLLKGCHLYSIEFVYPSVENRSYEDNQVGHGPHVHKDAELLMHLGTNPNDPSDLGAEIDLFMGPEMEKHTIKKTCVVYIPPGFLHCPWIIKKAERPFIFIEVNQGPMHTEKSVPEAIPEEDWDRMVWIDEGYEGIPRRIVEPKGLVYRAKEQG